jgi:hypothetical protein
VPKNLILKNLLKFFFIVFYRRHVVGATAGEPEKQFIRPIV